MMDLPVYENPIMRVWARTPILSTPLGIMEVVYGAITAIGRLYQAIRNPEPSIALVWEASEQAQWIVHGLIIAIPVIGNIGIYYSDWVNGDYTLRHPLVPPTEPTVQ